MWISGDDGMAVDGRERLVSFMENLSSLETVVGRLCQLVKPVRDQDGRVRFNEKPKVIREVNNLDRRMFLVQFEDGSTTFLFPDEVVIE
jgi:hypothetical protein